MSTGEPLDTNDSAAGRFLRLWESNSTPPDVFAFLASEAELSAAERVDVVRIDQRRRRRIGRSLTLKAYLQALPDVAPRADLVRLLIEGDRRARRLSFQAAAGSGLAGTSVDEAGGPRSEVCDDATLIASKRREPPTTVDPAQDRRDLDDSEATAPPGSTRDGGPLVDAEPADTFRLDDRGPEAADVDSLQAMLDADRFTVVRRIGVGGMGVVFEVFDHDREEVVALKTMRRVDPETLGRFKQEFRSLADVAHVNLASLFQLFAMDDRWFFTMEMIEGTDFLSHVRGGEDASADRRPPGGRAIGRLRPDRLRAALVQLVEGVRHLHALGKLHRDLKPTNVLVTEEGRVVVLDFGLTVDFAALAREGPAERQIVGTAAHMSPEQAAGREASPASDWYSVGVMIFQALTGRLPFDGSVEAVMRDKQHLDAPDLDLDPDDPPADLAALCRDLLRRTPDARPSASTILDRLEGRPASFDEPPGPDRSAKLVGRERPLKILKCSYESMKSGRIETVFLRGGAGAGKSAVLRTFLDELERGGEAVVLAGRCHQRESVPFKAIDSMIDALASRLRSLPDRVVETLTSADAAHLAQVFPVLKGVEGFTAARSEFDEPADPQEGRLRAFTGLRDLLARLGARGPLVLAIDDLQWGDADSAVLLADLLYSPEPPVLLFVGSFRDDEPEASRFLQILRQTQVRVGATVSHREVLIEPLDPTHASELALTLLDRDDAAARTEADLVAVESEGNPLLIGELISHIRTERPPSGAPSTGRLDLQDVLAARIGRLSDEAVRILELVAVAGRPIDEPLIVRAGSFGPTARIGLLALRSARMIRCKCLASCDAFEVYHDPIREAVLKRLSPESLADLHGRLARAYESEPDADPEVIAGHLCDAGRPEEAAEFYESAAARAASAFAFEHAARLYRKALAGAPADATGRRSLLVRLADALANAGRGGEAAATYLEAADSATDVEAIIVRRLAASQLLISGRLDEGTRLLRTILRPLRLSMPATPRRTLMRLAWQRARLRFRGLHFQPRAESEVPSEILARIDVCWSIAVGLGVVDPIQSVYFQTRGLSLALQAGESYRIARGLAMKAAQEARAGRSAFTEVERLLATAGALAERARSPHARGIVAMAQGSSALMMGEWRRASEMLQQAESQFRNRCVGATWELDTTHVLSLWAAFHRGDLTEISKRYHELQREARERGDLYAASTLEGMFGTIVRLAADAPDVAAEPFQVPRGRNPGVSVHLLSTVRTRVENGLYHDRIGDAWTAVEAAWAGFARSPLSRIQMIRIQVNELRARVALAAAERCDAPEARLRIVERHVRNLEREAASWCEGYVHQLRAGLATLRDDPASALRELESAACAFEKSDMLLHARVARLRAVEIRVGEGARSQIETSWASIRALGVAAPESWARMIAPGFSRIAAAPLDRSS